MPRLSKIGAAALAAFGWTGLSSVSASYLVVAGGGGSGRGSGTGGGGAGGFQTNTISLNPTLSYTVTVGAGGAGGTTSAPYTGSNGNDSVFSTITSTGGGGGGSDFGPPFVGLAGGSGGGSASAASATVYAGGAGTSGQGNTGGSGGGTSGYYIGGGGGGAGAVGGNASGFNGGNGGNGSSSSISGSSVTYAGGGAGGGDLGGGGSGGSGGTGGGGGINTAGTANTGGGGGGRNAGASGVGAAGGSGIVIISYTSATQLFGGGTVTQSGGNFIHTFTSSGALSPLSSVTASYLVVAGGGGGGDAGGGGGGGGGAGGLLSGSGLTLDSNSIYTVTVGSGGAGSVIYTARGSNGSNSAFSVVTTAAVGGGAGGSYPSNQSGNTGGSGGGGGGNASAGSGGAGTSGQGNTGGNGGSTATVLGGGGGGGASAVGSNATITSGGNGGAGTASSISGSSVTYAGGGGGAAGSGGLTQATGGAGGGGNGALRNGSVTGTAGTANTGGGGGGGWDDVPSSFNGTAQAGGSGVVIISYAGSTQQMAGGTVTITGGNVIHTFTSSGYLTPIKLVNNSLRFRSSASAYLNRTPATASNRKTWTWSGWVKRGVLGGSQMLFDEYSAASDNNVFTVYFTPSNTLTINGYSSSWRETTQVFRDPAAWYHIVIALDTTQATAGNRVKLYVNGVEVTSFSVTTNPTLNADLGINQAATHTIGKYANGSLYYFDGYLTEINFIDGQALTPNSFGTFNSYGVWQPITYGGSYGTNGFYLPFSNTASPTTLAYDFSPNGNNWTPNNISVTAGATYDSMVDSPTVGATSSNYCVLNPLDKNTSSITISDGNLKYATSGTNFGVRGSISVSSGKWYWETTITAVGTGSLLLGIANATWDLTYVGSTSGSYGYFSANGNKGNNTSFSAYGATFTTNDVIGVALDMDSGTLTFYKNNTSQGTAFTGLSGSFFPAFSGQTSDSAAVNFGQRPFSYTPPTGFVALNTYNL